MAIRSRGAAASPPGSIITTDAPIGSLESPGGPASSPDIGPLAQQLRQFLGIRGEFDVGASGDIVPVIVVGDLRTDATPIQPPPANGRTLESFQIPITIQVPDLSVVDDTLIVPGDARGGLYRPVSMRLSTTTVAGTDLGLGIELIEGTITRWNTQVITGNQGAVTGNALGMFRQYDPSGGQGSGWWGEAQIASLLQPYPTADQSWTIRSRRTSGSITTFFAVITFDRWV